MCVVQWCNEVEAGNVIYGHSIELGYCQVYDGDKWLNCRVTMEHGIELLSNGPRRVYSWECRTADAAREKIDVGRWTADPMDARDEAVRFLYLWTN